MNMDAEIYIKINFITGISFWNALKLRLAGGEAIKAFIEAEMEKIKIKKDKKDKKDK